MSRSRFWLRHRDLLSIALPIAVTALWLIGLDTIYSFTPSVGIFVRFFGRTLLVLGAIVVSGIAIMQAFAHRYGSMIGVVASITIGLALEDSEFLVGDYIHLAVKYPVYQMQIGDFSSQASKATNFDWGGTGFLAAGRSSRTLVYDPTYALSRQLGINKAEEGVWVRTRHLIGSFYTIEQQW